jgi:hypothetical protein
MPRVICERCYKAFDAVTVFGVSLSCLRGKICDDCFAKIESREDKNKIKEVSDARF